MRSPTMTWGNGHGTRMMTCGSLRLAQTRRHALTMRWSTFMTSRLPRKSRGSERRPASFVYQEEIRKVKEHMWEAGQLKDASAHRLEGANALNRIEAALQELDHQMAVREEHVRTECGRST